MRLASIICPALNFVLELLVLQSGYPNKVATTNKHAIIRRYKRLDKSR